MTLTKTSESSQPASTNEPCAASATTCVEHFVSLHASIDGVKFDFHTGDDQGRRTPGEQRGHAEQPAREVHAQDRRDQGDECEHVVLVFKLDAVAPPQRRARSCSKALDPGLRLAPRRDALRRPRRDHVPEQRVQHEQRELYV